MVAGLVALVVAAVAQQPGIDLVAYDFKISLPDSGGSITGLATVTFRSLPDRGDTVSLDLVGLSVDSVLWHGISCGSGPVVTDGLPPSIPFSYDGAKLRIELKPVCPGEQRLYVAYHGQPRDGLVFTTTAHGRRVVFADNWLERARQWIPTVDHPSDKARVSFVVGVPIGWKVVSNGYRWISYPQGKSTEFRGWLEGHPIPTYTMVVGAGEFTVSRHRPVVHGRDTIPIEVWTYPEDSAYADSVPFRRATEIVETMVRLVGPFPYEKLAHVESSTKFGGMENASAIFYAEKPYVERRMQEGVVRHETAHQWFGDAVTERDWHHLWLSEGFASYFDWVIGATFDGDSVLEGGMRANAESYFKSGVVDRPIIDTAEHDLLKLLNENNYQKGSWVLHMLRRQVGDSAFWRGLREYYRRYRDSTALSEDLRQVMERASRQKLGWFFQQWLYQPGYPQLDCAWAYDSVARHLNITVSQTQPAAWGLFRLPDVPLEIALADGAVLRRRITVRARRAGAALALPREPAQVRLDPDGHFLLRVTRCDAAHGRRGPGGM